MWKQDTIISKEIKVKKMTGGLDVTVLDNSTGQPVSGLNVGCTQSGTDYYDSKNTDSAGKVRFTGLATPGGFVSIVVNQGGYLGYEQKRVKGITVYENQYTQRTVKLAPDENGNGNGNGNGDDEDPQNYSVTVNDESGNPIEGALIDGRWYDQADASHKFDVVTNVQGKAQVFRTPPSNVEHWTILLVKADGYGSFATATELEPSQHTFTVTLPPESLEGRGVVLVLDPRVTTISPGQTIKIYAEIWNGGKADNIKITWGLLQTEPHLFPTDIKEASKHLEAGESFIVDEDFTLPEDYAYDSILVIATGYHEE